jgi:hypothetical protein
VAAVGRRRSSCPCLSLPVRTGRSTHSGSRGRR